MDAPADDVRPRTVAVLYAAKSTEDKRGSIPTQLSDCRAMAEREDWEIVGEFSDEASSAYRASRGPGLAQAKELAAATAIERGECVLLVAHSDRLARGDGEVADHLAEIWFWAKRNRVRLRSVEDDANFEDAIRAVLIGERNYEDSKRKSTATRAGVRRRAERGHFHGGPRPYGYRYDRDRNDDADAGRLTLAPAAAEIVRRIFRENLAGAGHGRIAHELNADEIPSPTGRQWDKSQIANMLKSPVYAGLVHLNGETFPGDHEPIVDRETWDAVQRLRQARARSSGGGRGRNPKGRHLLVKGILRCGRCGGAMSPRTFDGPRPEVYRCLTRNGHRGSERCDQPQLPRPLVDEAVLRYFEEVGLDEAATLAQLRESTDHRLAETLAMRELAEREVQLAEERLARVRRDYTDGTISADDWGSLREELEPELEASRSSAKLHVEREEAARREAAERDVSAEVVRQVAQLRATVAGRLTDAEGLQAARAAITELFEGFVLRRTADAPAHVAVWPNLLLGEFFLEPIVRSEAVAYGPWVIPTPGDMLSPDEPVRLEDALRLGVHGTIEYELHRTPLRLRGQKGDDTSARSALSHDLVQKEDDTSALSAGSNALLRLGATPLTSAGDVLESFGIEETAVRKVELAGPAHTVLERLRDAAGSADELARATELDAAELAVALSELELAGLAVQADGVYRAVSQ